MKTLAAHTYKPESQERISVRANFILEVSVDIFRGKDEHGDILEQSQSFDFDDVFKNSVIEDYLEGRSKSTIEEWNNERIEQFKDQLDNTLDATNALISELDFETEYREDKAQR